MNPPTNPPGPADRDKAERRVTLAYSLQAAVRNYLTAERRLVDALGDAEVVQRTGEYLFHFAQMRTTLHEAENPDGTGTKHPERPERQPSRMNELERWKCQPGEPSPDGEWVHIDEVRQLEKLLRVTKGVNERLSAGVEPGESE